MRNIYILISVYYTISNMKQSIITKMKGAITSYFSDWKLFEKIWLAAFTLITIGLFIAWHDSWIGLAAALTGMLCVVLAAKGKISNYYVGIPNILLYAYIAYQNKYYGEVQLNLLYFLPMSIIGIILWKRHVNKKKSKDDVVARLLSSKERVFWIVIAIASVIIYGLFLGWIRGSLPFVDAATNVFSIIAMILMVKRAVEQWVSWIIVDVLTIIMWMKAFLTTGNDITILIMWVAYLVNAIYGLTNWVKLYRQAHKEAA